MAGKLDEDTQAANAGFFDIDRRMQELLSKGGWEVHVVKERMPVAVKREMLRHYVEYQRTECARRKPAFTQAYADYKKDLLCKCARPVNTRDVLGFLRDGHEKGHEKLSEMVFTSPEELERSATKPSRPRMVLLRSEQNRLNLRKLAAWCTKSHNIERIKQLGTHKRQQMLGATVRKIVNPACMCMYCKAHNSANVPSRSGVSAPVSVSSSHLAFSVSQSSSHSHTSHSSSMGYAYSSQHASHHS